jgi:hypothetical protein
MPPGFSASQLDVDALTADVSEFLATVRWPRESAPS